MLVSYLMNFVSRTNTLGGAFNSFIVKMIIKVMTSYRLGLGWIKENNTEMKIKMSLAEDVPS